MTNMDSSYFGGSSGGYVESNAHNLMDTRSKAILYVFKPYENQFNDVALRPFQYQFDDNFINDTQDINDLSKRGTAHAGTLIKDLMGRINLNDHMQPAFQSNMTFRASYLSEKHRFVLILTESASDLIGGNSIATNQSNSQVRRIYTGYFEDEPFNYTTFTTTKRSLNPNAFMVITHKTIVGTSMQMGRLGARTSVNTQASEEIIHPMISNTLIARNNHQSAGLHLMTPENCVNSIETTGEGYSVSIPGAHSDITKDGNNSQFLADLLEQPAHNVSQIVKGMILYQDDVTARDRLSTYQTDRYFEDSFLDESASRAKLGRFMALPRSRLSSAFDLDVDSRISPVDLDTLVRGDLDVQDFDLERPQYYETSDQTESSVTQQYSYLIAAVVTPILSAAGLDAMSFEYQIRRINNQSDDSFRTFSAEPNWTVPNHDLLQMTKAVEVELSRGIFSTIFHSKGDFHVWVNASTTGMTSVTLSLVGQGYTCRVPYELPSCMGGLISPLLGDEQSNASNSEAVEILYGVATGTRNVRESFNDDDNAFMDHANQLPWNQLQTIDPNHPRMDLDKLV